MPMRCEAPTWQPTPGLRAPAWPLRPAPLQAEPLRTRLLLGPIQTDTGQPGARPVLFQALIIAVFILHLPSRFFDPASLLRGWLPRNASFWIATGAGLALATALLTTGFVATTPIASYQFGLVWDSLLLAVGVSGVWTAGKVCWLVEHPGFRVVPMTAVALGLAYLAAVSVAAYVRTELLQGILTCFAG
jgi:hypothetical protein